MLSKILTRLEKAEVLSLDVFDTTLHRKVAGAEHVFQLMEEKLLEQKGGMFAGFAGIRQEADA